MILGDPDQAICAYRGATSEENFAAFARDFPEHDVVTLERNYRSTATILTAANALIAANRGRLDKRLWTTGPAGDPIAVEDADDELDEAQRIATWARAHLDAGAAPSALCVLVRVNELAAGIEQALMAARVPVHVAGALGFCDRAEIRDALAALSLVANPRDRLAFARVAKAAGAGVGEAACRALFAHADAHPEMALLEHGERSPLDALRPRQRAAVRELCAGLLEVSRRVAASARRRGGPRDRRPRRLPAAGAPAAHGPEQPQRTWLATARDVRSNACASSCASRAPTRQTRRVPTSATSSPG